MTRHPGDLTGIGQHMQDQAPKLDDPTLMAVGELLEMIGTVYEPDGVGAYDDLVRFSYRVASTWLLNQGRA